MASALTGSPGSRQLPFGPGTCRYPAGYPRPRPGGGTAPCRGFPLPFSRRPSLPGHPCPPGNPAPLTIGLPVLAHRTLTGFPRSAHTRYGRIGCPLYPGTSGAPASQVQSPARRLPPHNGTVLYPGHTTATYPGLCLTRHPPRVHVIHPPGLPLTRGPRMTRETLRLYPGLRTRTDKTRARTPGRGQASSTSLELRRQHLRHASPPIREFTRNMCDLVSHLHWQVSPPLSQASV